MGDGEMKTKRAKATDISQKVKKAVWERDGERCIICGSHYAMPNAHYIPRSKGGLGIEENIVTLCMNCHNAYDHTIQRPYFEKKIREYLQESYGASWNEKDLVYRRWEIEEERED